jgi:hypothetical protein
MIRPRDFPFDASLVRWIESVNSPVGETIIDHFTPEISFDLNPLLTERRKITLFLRGCLVDPRYNNIVSICFLVRIFDCFPRPILVTDYVMKGYNLIVSSSIISVHGNDHKKSITNSRTYRYWVIETNELLLTDHYNDKNQKTGLG